MTDISFASAVVILLLVTDPIGNIPLFVSLLRHVDPERRVRVIVRECAIAFALLTGCMIASYTVVDKQAVSAVLIPPTLQDWGANLGRVIVTLGNSSATGGP
jgi:small neutral amino acid transporter SnatA (MarC family)